MRRGAALGLAAAAAVATVVLVSQPGERSATDPAGPPTSDTGLAHGLEGEWQSDAVSAADVRSTLRGAGLATYADEVLAALPTPPFRIELSVRRSSLDLDLIASGTSERWDEETLVVREDRLLLQPLQATGHSVHRWVLDGDGLQLAFVSTDEGDTDDIPAEVWQRVLYDTATFRR